MATSRTRTQIANQPRDRNDQGSDPQGNPRLPKHKHAQAQAETKHALVTFQKQKLELLNI